MKNSSKLFFCAAGPAVSLVSLAFSTAYIISPAFCHRFVGYIEEEACSTYTKIIYAIDKAPYGGSELAQWRMSVPPRLPFRIGNGEEGTVSVKPKAVRAR
jgi:hypothetical protein